MKTYFFISILIFFAVLIGFALSSNSTAAVDSKSSVNSTLAGYFYNINLKNNKQAKVKDFSKEFSNVSSILIGNNAVYSLYIKNLSDNKEYSVNKNDAMYAASLYKLPVAVAVIKEIENGQISYNTKIAYTQSDFVEGTGNIYYLPYGSELTVNELLDKLLKDSDNIAQNMLLRKVSPATLMDTFALAGPSNKFYSDNVVSPLQISLFFENLLSNKYLSNSNTEILLSKMQSTAFDDRINSGLSSDSVFAHKIGNWGDTGSWHDCGVVTKNTSRILVCLMSKNTNFDDFLVISKKVGQFIDILN